MSTSNSPKATGQPTTPPRPSQAPSPRTQLSPRGNMYAPKPGPTSGMYDNHSASRAKYPQHASHHILQGELCKRVVYNDQDVMTALRIMDVPSSFVTSCAARFNEDLAEDIAKLQNIQAKADGVPLAELEVESSKARYAADPQGRIPIVKTARERDMYPPLQRIFDYIQQFPVNSTAGKDSTSGFFRRFQIESSPLLPNEDNKVGFPRWTPDFSLVHDSTIESGKWWRVRDGFVEVKPSSHQHPYPVEGNPRAGRVAERTLIYDNGSAKPLITQVANYSRLHLSARAFAIQSVGLMIFGCNFCVSIFNHANGRVSPCYNMWEDRDIFIRLVCSMTRFLTDYQLWQDPTTEQVAPESVGLPGGSGLDTYLIQPIGSDNRKWCTVGSNIWSSLSLFGRGTTVWPVQEYRDGAGLHGHVMVLKTALRSRARLPEYSIYQNIQGLLQDGEEWPQGLARVELGGDVGPHGPRFPIEFFTQFGAPSSEPGPTAVLHRIISAPMGRRVWDYGSELDLLKGLLCALEAHQWLCAKGWLHRDISAGNILLAMDPNDPEQAPGFLIDLEYARTHSDDSVTTQMDAPSQNMPGRRGPSGPHRVTHKRWDPPRGSPITGTLHFLSRRQLTSVASEPGMRLPPTPGDDVESFFFVLVYALTHALATSNRMDKLYTRKGIPDEEIKSRKKQLDAFFEQHWGITDIQQLHKSRFSGDFFMELIESNPDYAPAGTVGKWFSAPAEPRLLSSHIVKGILYRYVRKFTRSVFDIDSDHSESYSDSDSESDQIKPKPPPTIPAAPLGLAADKLFTHDELMGRFKKIIAKLEDREKERGQSRLNRGGISKLVK